MKDTVLDVLVYLFEHEYHEDIPPEALRGELTDSGYPEDDVEGALRWLADLRDAGARPELDNPGLRVYADIELEYLPTESRGFLLHLEQLGILSAGSRELVIERVMALSGGDNDDVELNVEQLRWIVFMVLFNLPGQDAATAWMEDLIYNNGAHAFH